MLGDLAGLTAQGRYMSAAEYAAGPLIGDVDRALSAGHGLATGKPRAKPRQLASSPRKTCPATTSGTRAWCSTGCSPTRSSADRPRIRRQLAPMQRAPPSRARNSIGRRRDRAAARARLMNASKGGTRQMTLATTPPLIDYVENGVTLVHAIPFQFQARRDRLLEDRGGVETVLVARRRLIPSPAAAAAPAASPRPAAG
jgi:hypothetical protein